jgi:hypothetical protein
MAAVREAGYEEETARGHAYQIVRRPTIQSALTEALVAHGLTPDKMARVIKQAAEAKTVVFNPAIGRGVLVDIPAHDIRLKAYDRWERAHGFAVPLTSKEASPPPDHPPLQVNIQFVTTPRPNGPAVRITPPLPEVTFASRKS